MRTLRSRLLAVLILGVAVPIALVGVWLANDTRREGEAMLRARLVESLDRIAAAIGERWVEERSRLLRVAEAEPTQRLLVTAPPAPDADWNVPAGEAATLWELGTPAELRDSSGTVRAVFGRDAGRANRTGGAVTVGFSIPVFESGSSRLLGSLSSRIPLSLLLSEDVWWQGVVGAVMVLGDSTGAQPLNPIPIPSLLIAADQFSWRDEEWIVERMTFAEPSLTVSLAAPVGVFREPFARAARRGSAALGGVLVVSLLLAALATRQIVEPLGRIVTASRAVAGGKLDQTVPERGPIEIRLLGSAFNAMTKSLRDMLRQRAQQESAAAVGEFAASLAHEVRNPLASLRIDLEHAKERLDQPERADQLISRAVEGVERLDRVVSGSLSIARSGALELTRVDVRVAIRGAARTASPTFTTRQAHLEVDLADTPLTVMGNEIALQQLFLNLLINAAEASGPGQSSVVSAGVDERSVEVTVSDHGVGVDPAILARVREPFFSTKEGGTGLGLAVAHRIAAAHGGSLLMESTLGAGTTVTLRLNRAD